MHINIPKLTLAHLGPLHETLALATNNGRKEETGSGMAKSSTAELIEPIGLCFSYFDQHSSVI